MPPPVQIGERVEPARARPVPFWRHGLAPPPRTMPRVRVACVPWRRAASSASTVSCTSGPLNGAPNTSSSSFRTPLEPPRIGASAIRAHLHRGALGPGHGAAHEHQVLVGDQLHDRQAALGHAAAAHLAGAADALEHARGRRRRADGARGADVVRAVGLGAGGEVVALDRALEALALRGARDLHGLPDLEGLDGHRVAHRQLARLVAELADVAQRRRVGLLEVAELRARQRLLAHGAEAELHRLIAVDVRGADAEHGAGAGLEHGDALDLAVVEEALGHAELLGEDRGHRPYPKASRISMSTPAGRWSSRWSESTVLGVGWWMSIRRLCVRISKCSWESLSLKGERTTV